MLPRLSRAGFGKARSYAHGGGAGAGPGGWPRPTRRGVERLYSAELLSLSLPPL